MLAWALTAAGAAATAYVGRRMKPYERTMKAHGGPGIVGLELARDPAAARRIVAVWEDEGVAAARTAIRLDWAFIPSYVLLGASLGTALDLPVAAGAVVVAGALDVVENVAMLRVLDGHDGAQRIAFPAAAAKWTLVGGAALLAFCKAVRHFG